MSDVDDFMADRLTFLEGGANFLKRHCIEFTVDDLINVGIFLAGDALRTTNSPLPYYYNDSDDDDTDDDTDGTEDEEEGEAA